MSGAIQTILFDLDGTISDSAPGILASLKTAFEEHQIEWPDDNTARSFLGPPFQASLPPFVGHDRLQSVIEAYRHRYITEKGMFNTVVYPGVRELLELLIDRGFQLAVATSKPEDPAREIIDHLGVREYFAEIGGDTFDGARGSKALVVGEVLRRLGNPDPATVRMIGDRHHDVDGAGAHGIDTIGVLWGYGDESELTNANAWRIVRYPADIASLL